MTAKEYLKQYDYAGRKVRQLEAEYLDELAMVDAIRSTSDNDGMPHGTGVRKPTEEKAIRLSDVHMRLIDAKREAIQKRKEVFDLISGIEGIEGEVLFERYIQLHEWKDICETMHYSLRGIYKIHNRALRSVQEVIDKSVHSNAPP